MEDIIAGRLYSAHETTHKFPYMNSDGRYYSELKGVFKPIVGDGKRSATHLSGHAIVKGTFDKATYTDGLKSGFEVVVQLVGTDSSGTPLYHAEDRTQAFASVQDRELIDALQTIEGVGDVYSERIARAFNSTERTFYDEIEAFTNGASTVTCGVPKRVILNVVDALDDIRQVMSERSVHEAAFYNALHGHGFVAFKGQTPLAYQRTIKEWGDVYKRLAVIPIEEQRRMVSGVTDASDLIAEYGIHFVTLLTHPHMVLDATGDPMDITVQKAERNVDLAHMLLYLANDELEPVDVARYGLEERGILAYSFDLYVTLKEYKDGGFNNSRDGDTVYPVSERQMHQSIQSRHTVPYAYAFDELVDAIIKRDKAYPVVLFYWGNELFGQFKRRYELNQSIVKKLKARQHATHSAYWDEDEYKQALDSVLADNNFGLHKDQYDTLVGLNNHTLSVLTGGPGTGKTTILSVFLRTLSKLNQQLFANRRHRVVFCAPTGRAAKRMKESLNEYKDEYPVLKMVQDQTYTIHSFLLNQDAVLEEAENDEEGSRWLLIDESSMVDEEMMHWILNKVPHSYRIVFIGDEAQLPSIGAGSVIDDLLTLNDIGRFNLTRPYRTTGTVMKNAYAIRGQKGDTSKRTLDDLTFDSSFVLLSYNEMIAIHKQELGKDNAFYQHVIAHAPDMYNRNMHSGWAASFLYKQMNDNTLNPDESMILMPFSHNKKEIQNRVAVTPFNQNMQGLLQPFRHVLPKHLMDLRYEDILTELNKETDNPLYKMNTDIQSRYGVLNGIGVNNNNIFRVGDRIMATRNQYETLRIDMRQFGPLSSTMRTMEELSKMWYSRLQQDDLLVSSTEPVMNGDMGEVKVVMRDGSVVVQFDDQEDENWVYVQRNSSFTDTISLSYSTTVHKSQGGEADTVILFLADENDTDIMNYRELFYTAMTRARKRVIMIGSQKALVDSMNTQKNIRHTALPYLFDNEGLGKGA